MTPNARSSASKTTGRALLAGATLLLLVATACGGGGEVTLTGSTMGTTYTVKVDRLPGGMTASSLQSLIDLELERVNSWMSTYREGSEISRFNRAEAGAWFEVAPETVQVVAAALQTARATGGAFDPTIGPLVNLWSFGPEAGDRTVPPDEAIDAALARVGYEGIEVRRGPASLLKQDAALELDLSGIAKGFGVDRLAEGLDEIGVTAYMVEIGGEVRVLGTKADGEPWSVGIETPSAERPGVLRVIGLDRGAVATSGDYRNYFERDGKRYSHMIDPRTGRPVEHALAAVTVVSRTCMSADGLSTALMVLGPDDGYETAVSMNLAALFIVREADGFTERPTPAFDLLTKKGTGY